MTTTCALHGAHIAGGHLVDHHCSSLLRQYNGRDDFTLIVPVIFVPQYWHRMRYSGCGRGRHDVIYRAERIPDSELEACKDDFRQSVHDGWNNKLVLYGVGPRNAQPAEISCSVDIQYVDRPEFARLKVKLLYRPRPSDSRYPFRASCGLGGAHVWYDGAWEPDTRAFDMSLDWWGRTSPDRSGFYTERDVPCSDHAAPQRFGQNTVAHEFGHYLGIPHTCVALATQSDLCGDEEYCGGRTLREQQNMMALGDTHDVNHAIPWSSRLFRHHRYCDRTWFGRVL